MSQPLNTPDNTKASSDGIPSLEELMDRLEKAGMQKYASEIRDLVAMFGVPSSGGLGVGSRPGLSRGRNLFPKMSEPGSPMLQEGDKYTDIDPQTGKETTKRYQMESPMPVSKLKPYFHKGMFDVDFFERELNNATDPKKKEMIRRLLDMAEKREVALRSDPQSKESAHWMTQPSPSLRRAPGQDATEQFLLEAIKSSPDTDRATIQALLDKYKATKTVVKHAMDKIASGLRSKGYDALAKRMDGLVGKEAARYEPGKGVRVRSFKEYIEESRTKNPKGDKDLYGQMFRKYEQVMNQVLGFISMTKAAINKLKPDDDEGAVKAIIAADQLMMQKLLEIGELTEMKRGEGI